MLNYTLSYSLSPKTGKCLFSNRNLNAATFFTLLHWSSSNVIISYCSCRNEFYKGGRGQKSPYSTEEMSFFRKLADHSNLKIPIGYSLFYLFFSLPTLWKHQSPVLNIDFCDVSSLAGAESWNRLKLSQKQSHAPSPGFALRSISVGFPIKQTKQTLHQALEVRSYEGLQISPSVVFLIKNLSVRDRGVW